MNDPATSHTQPLSVVVVDDDAAAAQLLARAVTNAGHECAVAFDGESALELAEEVRANVVISDWVMPHMDGLELCRRLRAVDDRYVYFMLMTAKHERGGVATAMQAGADDYLEKPIDVDVVEARLVCAQRVLGVHAALRERNQRLRRDSQRFLAMSRMDALTGAPNRRALAEDLVAAREDLARYGTACAVAMCDVDFFKAYNDAHGHIAGDDALRHVVEAVESTIRASDRVYRYGGEEFVVLLHQQDVSRARAAMERVRAAVEHIGRVTISVGVADLRADDKDEEALARADAALYQAKRGGRNRVVPRGA